MQINYPYPSRTLSPNGRAHWRKLADAKRSAKRAAYYLTLEAIGTAKGIAPVRLSVTFHPKTANTVDLDNVIAGFKAFQDGIAQALGVDDSQFVPVYKIGAPVKGGRVTVEITSAMRIPHKGTIS